MRCALASTKRASLGVLASGVSELAALFGADWRQPLTVMRSLRFGGSGCAVPGVGFPPLTDFPPICALATSTEPATNAIRTLIHKARCIRRHRPGRQSDPASAPRSDQR